MRPAKAAAARAVAVLLCASSIAAPAAAAKDGVLDVTFGAGGEAGTGTLVHAAALLPNQDVAVIGGTHNDDKVRWARLETDGGLPCASNSVPEMTSFAALAVLVDHSGNPVIAGAATTTGSSQERPLVLHIGPPNFAALDHCGTTDTSWSGDGFEQLDSAPFCDTEDCRIDDLAGAQGPSDRLFALVESVLDATTSRFFVVALNPGGHVDTSFGSQGWAEVPYFTLGFLTARGSRLALDPQGRPLVLVTRINSARGDKDCLFVRFDVSGSVDRMEPVVDLPSSDDVASAFTVAEDGTVFAAVNSLASGRTGWLYERSPAGSWSGSGRDGRAIADIALQGDNKVLALADSTDADQMMLNRMIRTPTGLAADFSFGPVGGEGDYDVDLGGSDAQRSIALLLSTGRPVILGNASTDNGPRGFALRVANSYVFFDGFERGNRAAWSADTF